MTAELSGQIGRLKAGLKCLKIKPRALQLKKRER